MIDSLLFWRLHDSMTVPNAAILMVGGDPGEKIQELDDYGNLIGLVQKRSYVGYEAACGALKSAVIRGEIEAKIAYGLADAGPLSPRSSGYRVVAARDLWALLPEVSEDPFGVYENRQPIQISREPDWEATFVEVESLKRWLRSKGATDGFFVSATTTDEGDSFTDPGHEHFAPELSLAVSAWRGLAAEQRFPRGPKAAIEGWIDANPDAWLGDGNLSASAKERIVTLINWRKSGGAPTSGG
jgi:hypothetical protein